MKIAATTKILEPKDPFYMLGYVNNSRQKPAQGIHDKPEINSLLIEQEGEYFFFSVVDVCTFTIDKTNQIKHELSIRFGWKTDRISLIALHTHSGPNGTCGPVFGISRENPGFLQQVTDTITESAEECLNHLQEGTAQYRVSHIHECYCNRNDKKAPFDDSAIQVQFIDLTNNPIAELLNISCHSTVIGPGIMESTYDFLGTVRKKVRDVYSIPVITMMGAAGDTSNRQYRQGNDFLELERVSSMASRQIIDDHTPFKTLKTNYAEIRDLNYAIDYDNRRYYEEYRNKLKETEAILKAEPSASDQYKLSLTSKMMFEEKLKIEQVHKIVRAVIYDFDELRLLTFGGELSSRFGCELKRKYPEKCIMIITCADDHQGYFIEKEQYGKYYETIATDTPIGEPEKIVERMKNLL